MSIHSLVATLVLATSVVPHTAPFLCSMLSMGADAHMESCPDAVAPLPGASDHGCDMARCATPSVAPPLEAAALPAVRPIGEATRGAVVTGITATRRPPLTPPPIA